MNFKAHAKAGISVSLISMALTGYFTQDKELSIIVGLSTFIGSLFPDLDTESIVSRWTARLGFIAILASWYYNFPEIGLVIGAGFMLVKSGKHRGFTHNYLLPIVFLIIGIVFNQFWMIGFCAGLITHYSLDSINPIKQFRKK